MTRTAKKRIERAVERIWYKNVMIYPHEIVSMIMAERARLKRKVKAKQRITVSQCSTSQFCAGYRVACADILKLWEA